MRYREILVAGVPFLVLVLIVLVLHEFTNRAPEAEAIPAFARKYDFKCNVCHVPGFPKLNDFGNLFRDRGYQMGSDADLPTFEGINMGFWPVSFRTTVGNQIASLHTGGATGNISTNAVGFTSLDILSFGTLDRDIAHRIVLTGQPSGSFGLGGGAGKTPDLESAAVKLMRLEKYLGVKSDPGDYLLNLLVGKHEVDVPFSEKRSPSLNTSYAMYHYVPGVAYTSGTLKPGGTFPINGGYLNPNQFGLGDNQPGIELTGITKTKATGGFFRYTLDALFTNPSTSSPLGFQAGCPSVNSTATAGCANGGSNVNFYGHMTQSFGGYGIVTGHRIGVFGLYGNMPTHVNSTCSDCAGTGGNYAAFSRIGVDFSTTFNGEWNLFGAFMRGNDSKNLFASQASSMTFINNTSGTYLPPGGATSAGAAQNASWNGAFIELNYYPTLLPVFNVPDWFFSYRYDVIRNDRQGFSGFQKNFNNVDSHTAVVRYFIHQSTRTDVALHWEYNWYQTKGVATSGANLIGQTMFTGVDFAF
jgi:hypothetical protein